MKFLETKHPWAVFRYFFWGGRGGLNASFCAGNANMVMALAGNKADLEDKRKVPAEVYAWFFQSTILRIFYLLMELVVIFIFFNLLAVNSVCSL